MLRNVDLFQLSTGVSAQEHCFCAASCAVPGWVLAHWVLWTS